jgi:hypothetical protein
MSIRLDRYTGSFKVNCASAIAIEASIIGPHILFVRQPEFMQFGSAAADTRSARSG